MNSGALDVIEFLLTARVYSENRNLDENDLPPKIRQVFWHDGTIERPLRTTVETAREATGLDQPWDAISELMFTDRDTFSGSIELTQQEMAEEWFVDRDEERIAANPTLAYALSDRDGVDASYEAVREANRPVQSDRAWIDSLLEEHFDEDEDEDGESMLDLVDIHAPEEVELTLDDLVLTEDQEAEIHKIVKAIEHREYLAEIGLREIGKLLFVGPPGTAKTSTARALGYDLDLPFVEVKLSMITSQYLGETAKNVEKVFEVAKRLSPCILFMDEFDFVAKTRRSDEHAAIKRAVNTLLKSIDNISLIEDDVLLIGATNHPDQLDAAAWRRFDDILNFPKPDEQMRSDILRVITRRMRIANFDPDEIAEMTEGLTGSDLRLVLREAVLEALTEERTELTQEDLHYAIQDFEERDHLKDMDMIDGDHDALVAGGDISGHSHDH
ncbi:AAA ATPase central domain protein [Haladaptatus paucihalophilus DX253]|uniref:AAA ATPase central domain protein n=1 Tax=Haladaptatus paucihalophilus DX253 TaxID=797209 RepID=E7QNE3_HALPU|nr:ATP-binding protein [Haladaptatus paucihalophilus]EFW93938.1 AAA ATPase central domain protein [Haladaptatus paucihalophilus DX253]SHK66330.1 AAA+-type ATPase, SpoVK/Ycf46/Vps4 family [Haladaptatus paucihalophilus DX253]